MNVVWLSLTGFRSYLELEWRPDEGVNLLIGANGAGKTNLLEAIAYVSTLRSLRSVPDEALVNDDSDVAVIRTGVVGGGRERLVEMELRRAGRRRVQIDKTAVRRSADLLGVLRVVAFLPDNLDLVKRGPALRRDLLDETAVQLWPTSYLDQMEYERALRQRNAFLKLGGRDVVTLAVWDSKLAQAGGKVMARRVGVMDVLDPILAGSYRDIAGETAAVAFTYRTSWGDRSLVSRSAAEMTQRLGEALEAGHHLDYERRMTMVGPHRDEPGFLIAGVDARTHASQGEQRTMALAVKLACHRAIAEITGDNPVLLLDDVFSELDSDRAAALAKSLPPETQTLITSAHREDLPVSGRVWGVTPDGLR
ncbi:MAG: DNA replication/repair protein RecF [Actinobacteria bacterium]|nr:DNA replication/repair protein RecF [Actinomycetota bacterium]MCI0678932.1 DNA replication/repair protein RecF [Actinomycetota bacterium]